MSQANSSLTQRRAFTLTELLVVIAIIAMLVALTSVGVMTAMAKARATKIKTELDQIDSAMKSYKEKYGAYPPCDLRNPGSNAALKQHIAMAFPRYNLNNLPNELAEAGVDTTNFRPDQALYFFLRGFSPDPTNPFVTPKNEPIRNGSKVTGEVVKLTPIFEFDQTRLGAVDDTGADVDRTVKLASYFPPASPVGTTGAPYVYWDSRVYGDVSPNETRPRRYFNADNTDSKGDKILYSTAGVLVPYWFDSNSNKTVDAATETWANPDSFQLIAPGIDKKYSSVTRPTMTTEQRLYPSGFNYDASSALADDDNTTNFTSKARIGDDKP